MPRVLLFVDLLGVRAAWQHGGRSEAESAFKAFRSLVAAAVEGRTREEILDGIIETDAMALHCADTGTALDIGQNLYQMAFRQTATNNNKRPWLRGVIVPRVSELPLRRPTSLRAPLNQISLMLYEPELFDAIAIEKSGIKGMRLLIDKDLLTAEVNSRQRLAIGRYSFIPFKRIHSGRYPREIAETHVDYFWMASSTAERRRELSRIMHLRLRLAAQDPEEFAQAAATQVAFLECEAIIGSLRTRQKYQDAKKAGRKH